MAGTAGMFAGSEAIHIATVLEDCVDQLSVLGKIMPHSFDGRPDAYSLVHSQMKELMESQQDLETRYQSILAKKLDLKHSTSNRDKLTEIEKEVLETGGDLKNSTHVFTRSVRQNPLTGDNMTKIQDDSMSNEPINPSDADGDMTADEEFAAGDVDDGVKNLICPEKIKGTVTADTQYALSWLQSLASRYADKMPDSSK